MMCMCVCVHYSSFEYESPYVSCVALNALHTLYLGVFFFFFVTQIWIHITASELLFQCGDYEAFFDVGNDPEPLMILIALVFVSSQQSCTKLKLKIFFLSSKGPLI